MLIFAVKMKLFYPPRAKLFGLLTEFAKAAGLEGKLDDLACGCHKHCKLKGKKKISTAPHFACMVPKVIPHVQPQG